MQVADSYIHVVRYRRLSRQEFDELSERLFGLATDLARSVRRSRDTDYIGALATSEITVSAHLISGVHTRLVNKCACSC